ncbi:Rhodanese-related sulfurtransferase [Soonwooa buanensis]|uniref:Rhodanese-related sulfurtransferase n=1 Tax=Soonwooa buanensis TaxID=619805 RepID=A0A1T5FU01_9FLAO|nr:rhodanese-like domain-containing protein [Soonwooa buanensis]SKB99649.1 Rhodanese-related sulfurtransferase [Soonwooa buanensis]
MKKYMMMSMLVGLSLTSCQTVSNANVSDQKVDMRSLVNDPQTTLIDVRIPEQYAEGTADNAVNIPLKDLESQVEDLKSKDKIVVFCNTGKQAASAKELLTKHGIKNVYSGTSWKNVKAIQEESKSK